MFDIGFSEIFLFGVIALIVLGPEKLPQAARTAGQWYAKLRRTVSTIQSEIEAELDLAETRQQMQDELANMRKARADIANEMAEMRGNMQQFETSQNQSFKQSSKASSEHSSHHTESSDNASSTDPIQSVSPSTEAKQPVMTRPWENMWFRLGAYDRARRLPAAPYLPNYKADTLLYNHSVENASVAQQQVKP